QLLAEGYLTSRERSGFFAAQVEVWGEPEQGGADIRQKAWSLKKKKGDHLSCRFNFHGSVVDTKHFPYAAWRSCMLEALDRYPDDFAFYGDDQGEWEL
ncbi:PLP-dependent aminotransferase family protein, partial [Mesorhizobium sp. M00.F.Ca.ET.186.01.1.1]